MSARLFEPLRLDDLELENRIIIAPMCQYSALAGAATDWHLMHL
ncbi:oxidoreductase, partial [Idiomarina sp. ST20R2A10]